MIVYGLEFKVDSLGFKKLQRMKEYSFEKLDVWQLSRKLAGKIYILTSHFPESEKFGMINQIRRAVISITTNLAEGTSRNSYKEKIRFIEISFSSLMEVLNCIIICKDFEWLSQKEFEQLRNEIDTVANKLSALRKSFKEQAN